MKGMYNSDRCKFCKDFGAKTLPFVCPNCAGDAFDLVLSFYKCDCPPEYTERGLISPHCRYHDLLDVKNSQVDPEPDFRAALAELAKTKGKEAPSRQR